MEKNNHRGIPERTSGSLFSQNWEASDITGSDEPELKTISVCAILCMLGGFLSLSLYLSIYFCFVPALTILLALVTLLRMRLSGGMLLGRGMALAGLWLAIVFAVAVPTHHISYRETLRSDAKKYCDHWCSVAKQGDFCRIKQLTHVPHFLKLDMTEDAYWRQYFVDEETHTELHRFLSNKLLLTLAALGPSAQYSYYRTDTIRTEGDTDYVAMTYAVTYPNEKKEKETFFIQINAHRQDDPKRKIGLWKGGDKVKGPLDIDSAGVPIDPQR